MKQYDTDFLESFESIDTKLPPQNKQQNEETYRLTMAAAGLQKPIKRIKKRTCILLAAAIVMIFSVSAGAYELTTGSLFKNYFAKTESNSGAVNSLTESQVAKINEAGTLLNQVVTNNGTTIQIRAAVGDKSCAYILLDVTAPKGTVLDKDNYEFAEMPIEFHNAISKTQKGEGSSISWDITAQKDTIPNDNKKSLVIRINCAGIDLQNRNIQMTLKDLSLPNGKLAYTTVVKGEWKFDMKLDYSTVSKNIQVNKVTHYSDDYSTIQTVSLSTLSASVKFSDQKVQDNPDYKDIFRVPDLIVEMKDGTHSTILSGAGSGDQGSFSTAYQFTAPLDFDKVAKITLGDVEIPIK